MSGEGDGARRTAVPSGARVRILRRAEETDRRAELEEDVRRGLASDPKELPPKYFYDARGSRLFERITELPEYYLTRAERRILERRAPELVAEVRPETVVEFGAGSAVKARILLEAARDAGLPLAYAPIDVSEAALREAAVGLASEFPGLRVLAVVGDFRRPAPLPFEDRPRLLLFLGSTIGNLEPAAATRFLRRVAEAMTPRDAFLIGFDLVKEPQVLEAAYDDAEGVTAAFNRNVLRVLNRELGADFDLTAFRHRAFYDRERARIEMHLVSDREQTVRIAELELEVRFAEGETIRTELSHKYTRESALGLVRDAGLASGRWLTDPEDRFGLALVRREA